MADDTLRTALVDLVRAASSHGITIFLGGGYGLYLKQIHLTSTQQRTFLPVEAWPRPRGTPDLDIFLPTEIVVDLKHMTRFREILDGLGYKPVPTARFMHFEKQVSQGERCRRELSPCWGNSRQTVAPVCSTRSGRQS